MYWLNPFFSGNDDEDLLSEMPKGGLSISEDNDHVYVEADVPGIDPEKIEVTYKNHSLWIKAQKEEKDEDKDKKFYRHSRQDYSYHAILPDNVDEGAEPKSSYENGIVKITFAKRTEEKPKTIPIRRA